MKRLPKPDLQESSEGVQDDHATMRREALIERLRRDIDQARSELDRGEGIELADSDALRVFFDEIRARGRRRVAPP